MSPGVAARSASPRTVTRTVPPRSSRGNRAVVRFRTAAGAERRSSRAGRAAPRRPPSAGRLAPRSRTSDPRSGGRSAAAARRASSAETPRRPRHAGRVNPVALRPRRVLERDRELEGPGTRGRRRSRGREPAARRRCSAVDGARRPRRAPCAAARIPARRSGSAEGPGRDSTSRAGDHPDGRRRHDEGVVAEGSGRAGRWDDGDGARRPVRRRSRPDHSLAREDGAAQRRRLGRRGLRRGQRRDPRQAPAPGQLQETELLRARGRRSERRDGDGEEHGSGGRHRVCSTFGSEADKRSSSTGANVMSRKRAK